MQVVESCSVHAGLYNHMPCSSVQALALRHTDGITDLFTYYFSFSDAVESSDDALQRCDTEVLQEMERMLK